MSQIKITPLGSLGWIPARNRQTCCYCVEYKDHLIIFDAGTGIVRFGEPVGAEILEKYGKVYLFLSHYHFDHVMGLHYLPPFFRDKEVHIAGPGRSLYNQSVAEILAAVTAPSFYSRSIDLFPMNIHIHDLEPGSNDIDG
ncbi:MAG: MBL fold metallo-hydrolase, partial [bacterium]|nr:MBL fold metallo-hydrolase [bacterium]